MTYSQAIHEPLPSLLGKPNHELQVLQDQACFAFDTALQLDNEIERDLALELMVRLFLVKEWKARHANVWRRDSMNFGFLGRAEA